MFSRTATRSNDIARRDEPESIGPPKRLRNLDDSTVVLADSGAWPGNFAPLAPDGKARPIPVLATLLTPFAGGRSSTIAESLISRFGTIGRLLAAPDEQIIAACKGYGRVGEMIAGAKCLVLAGLKESVTRSQVDVSDPNLRDYLVLKFGGRPHEELHAIFVDHELGFLAEELVSKGTAMRVEARIAPLMRRAIELGATGIILVHNHPSSAAEASVEDVRATHQIVAVARALDLIILDHLIVAGNVIVSMRERGYL